MDVVVLSFSWPAGLSAEIGAKDLPKVDGVSAVEESTLATDPQTLIPYRLDITKTVGSSEDGQAGRVDKTTWTYAYSAPSKAAPRAEPVSPALAPAQ